MISSPQAELQRFIARLKIAEEDSRAIKRDLIALRQGIRDGWAEAGGRTLLAAFTGEVDGCTSHGFPGASVVVKDHASGVTLGTATCDSAGKYEVWANLDTDPQSLDVVASPAGAHAAKFAGPVTQNLSAHSGGNGVPTVVIPPASGFCCDATNYYPSLCCNFSLTVRGCTSLGVPGATVTVTETATGNVLATGTTSGGGVFAPGPFSLPANPTPVTIAITSPATDRLASQSFTTNLTPTTISLTRTLSLVSAAWQCIGGRWFPIPTTLHLTDSVMGPCALGWNALSSRYEGLINGLSFPGCGAYPADSSNHGVQYFLNPSGTLWSLGAFNIASGSVQISSVSFFTPTSPPFAYTGSTTGTYWHCAGVTYTLTE